MFWENENELAVTGRRMQEIAERIASDFDCYSEEEQIE